MRIGTAIENFALRVYGVTIGWFYPELRRLPDPLDRWQALMLIGLSQPRRSGCAQLIAMAIWTGLSVIAAFVLSSYLRRLGLAEVWIILQFMGTTAVLVFLGWCVMSWFDGRRTQGACAALMDNLDAATCKSCGYSLRGHIGEANVRCPECGAITDTRPAALSDSLR